MAERLTKAQLRKALDNAAKEYGVKAGIEPLTEHKTLELAYRVLAKHEPELLASLGAAPERRGAEEVWNWELSNQLIADINDERTRREKASLPSDTRTICRAIAKHEPWKTICASVKNGSEVLRQRYVRQTAGWKETRALLEDRKKALAAGDVERADRLWDKFLDTWETKAVEGYWAGVDIYENEEGDILLKPFKAENKAPKLPRIKALRSKSNLSS